MLVRVNIKGTIDTMATYTVQEAAELLRIGRNTAYEAVRTGAIPAIRIGRRIVVPAAALNHLLAVGTAGARSPAVPTPPLNCPAQGGFINDK